MFSLSRGVGIRPIILPFCFLSTLSPPPTTLLHIYYSVLLLGSTLSLKRAHALEGLDQHPEREKNPRRVEAVQEHLLAFGDRKGEVLILGQVEGGEDGEDSGDDMGRVNADPEGNRAFVVVERIGSKEEEGQLEECLAVKEGVEPDQGSVAHEGVSECLDVEVYQV